MVRTGLDRVFGEELLLDALRGRRLAWLTHAASVDKDLQHAVDLSLAAGLRVQRLFGPEHGIRGGAQDMVGVNTAVDPLTGLECVSLYGDSEASLQPQDADLAGVELMLIDLQDIGTRYYTYAATAVMTARACAAQEIEVWLLDRPNPLGGEVIEGGMVTAGFESFVGMLPVATRHAMTLGEIVSMVAAQEGWSPYLRVIEMQGWRRSQFFDQTGLPWVLPSPNMPTLDTALVYPGQCLLEGTNLSEGRGTTRPFELFGAPWLDVAALVDELPPLPGLAWRAVLFEPTFQKWAGQACRGLQMHITDRGALRSLSASIILLQTIRELHPDHFEWRREAYEFVADRLAIDLLIGDVVLRHAIEDGASLKDLERWMAADRRDFEAQRKASLLYR